jgi:hypothetical protein
LAKLTQLSAYGLINQLKMPMAEKKYEKRGQEKRKVF